MPTFRLMLAAGACLALAAPAFAADPGKEIAEAQAHAGMAAGAEAPQMVKAHLHHVLNCLEGPKGADFNSAAGDPCHGMGDGAIPDSAPEARSGLQAAAQKAQRALAEMNIDKAKAIAAEIQSDLAK